jgi:hypothetical protein
MPGSEFDAARDNIHTDVPVAIVSRLSADVGGRQRCWVCCGKRRGTAMVAPRVRAWAGGGGKAGRCRAAQEGGGGVPVDRDGRAGSGGPGRRGAASRPAGLAAWAWRDAPDIGRPSEVERALTWASFSCSARFGPPSPPLDALSLEPTATSRGLGSRSGRSRVGRGVGCGAVRAAAPVQERPEASGVGRRLKDWSGEEEDWVGWASRGWVLPCEERGRLCGSFLLLETDVLDPLRRRSDSGKHKSSGIGSAHAVRTTLTAY